MNNSWKKSNVLKPMKESTATFTKEELDFIYERISMEYDWGSEVYSDKALTLMEGILAKIEGSAEIRV